HQGRDRTELGLCERDRRLPARFVAHVEVRVPSGIADVLGHHLAEVVEHVAEHDARTLLSEEPRFGLTLSPCRTGDQCHLAVESSHDAERRPSPLWVARYSPGYPARLRSLPCAGRFSMRSTTIPPTTTNGRRHPGRSP